MRKILSSFIALLIVSQASATPLVSTTSGTIGTGNVLIISGSGFGTKARSKPLIWWDASNSSINPDPSLSTLTSWAAMRGAIVSGTGTRYGSNVITNNGASDWPCTTCAAPWVIDLEAAMPSPSYGDKFRWATYRRSTYVVTGRNIKPFRAWPAGGSGYPNSYIGDDNWTDGTNRLFYSENGSPVTGSNRVYIGSYNPYGGSWTLDEIIIKRNSSAGTVDGSLEIRENNSSVAIDPTFTFDYSPSPSGLFSRIAWQDAFANTSSNPGNGYFEALYLDDSWGVVMVGDASTYAACTHLEYQPYTSWTSGSINIVQKLGTLSGTTYLYVCDDNNVCSANGFKLSSVALSNPIITSISPGNGPAAGNTSVTINGTGFSGAVQVKFGNNFASSVVLVNSTKITCKTPAGIGGTAVDTTVINGDSVNAVLPSSFSYDPVTDTINPVTEVCPCK